MSAGAHDMASGSLSRQQVLDELQFLATVEHALIVEYLSVCCAFGHDLGPDEGGAATQQGRDVAEAAFNLAAGEMFHLKAVNSFLVDAGRPAQLGRATRLSSDSVAEIGLGPPSLAQLERARERAAAIPSAVEERYARLRSAATDQAFEGDLLHKLQFLIDQAGPHAAAFTTFRDVLGDLVPVELLRATLRDPADAFERRLLTVSDRSYGLVLAALREQFTQGDSSEAGAFRGLAISAMEGLRESHRVLVQRGLLPRFTPPD